MSAIIGFYINDGNMFCFWILQRLTHGTTQLNKKWLTTLATTLARQITQHSQRACKNGVLT